MGIGPGLPAIRAAAAAVGGFPLLAVIVYVADEHPAAVARAGAQTLEASVVRLYVVLIIAGWFFGESVRRCARLCGVHWGPFPLGRVPGSGRLLRGHYYVTPLFSHNRNVFATFLVIFGILSER